MTAKYVLLPIEPSDEMLFAIAHHYMTDGVDDPEYESALVAYRTMLSAAPAPVEAMREVERDAARYRWLRDPQNSLPEGGEPFYAGDALDAAVDAELNKAHGLRLSAGGKETI